MEIYPASMTAFDSAACAYDAEFTNTPIGMLQRGRVRHFMNRSLQENSLSILEINCGTGEDAVWLAQKGHEIIATDASAKMIEEAEKKISGNNLASQVHTLQLSFSELAPNLSKKKFDLLFSNFGGLNCVSENELKKLAADFSSLMKPGGKLMAVVMGRKCLWERFYFSVKGKFKEAFRRNSKEAVNVKLEGGEIATWYYTPVEFSKFFKPQFEVVQVKPVGLFIPPSYLNCFLADKKFLLNIFSALEKIFPVSFLSTFADHYFIELRKR